MFWSIFDPFRLALDRY